MAGPYAKDIYLPRGIATLTWAELYALNAASYNHDQLFYVSDVGVGGSYWYSNGMRWRAVNGACWLYNLPADVAHDGTISQLKLAEVSLPAGLIQQGDMLETHTSVDASGTGTNATIYHRLGTTGTTADASLGTFGQPAGASNVQGGMNKRWRRQTSTSMRLLDQSGASGLGGSGTALLVNTTVVDLDANATKLGIYLAESIGGLRICTLRNWAVELIAGA